MKIILCQEVQLFNLGLENVLIAEVFKYTVESLNLMQIMRKMSVNNP